MNKEIKEILDKLNKMIIFDESLIGWQIDGKGTTISKKDFKILRDYITNLQEEHRQTKLLKDRYQLKKEIYKLRIEKAIKYINENVAVYAFNDKNYPHWEFNDDNIKDLLNILQGDDKDVYKDR